MNNLQEPLVLNRAQGLQDTQLQGTIHQVLDKAHQQLLDVPHHLPYMLRPHQHQPQPIQVMSVLAGKKVKH